MSAVHQGLFDKIKRLSEQRLEELENFVDFLRSRDGDRHLTRAATQASESTFSRIWDNEEDAAYDRM